ncbi:SH3 domain-containing protein [Cystobacter fuscus]|uniref:SH3 domain-containing protein n=1 Tax=Cystobacter fuscus TaxID=43 RepID=UPI0037BEC76B
MGDGRADGADRTFVGQVGVVNWDGTPEVQLRASRSTTGGVLCTLPFSSRVQVINRFNDGWSQVATTGGFVGFVASSYIWTKIPEPNARLHRVEQGTPGTAIAICETYYADQIYWGQDLRFHVNVLGLVNHKIIPPGTNGWRTVRFNERDLIWIPDQTYTKSLIGLVDSGSISYDTLSLLASPIVRYTQLCEDYARAVRLSLKYLKNAVLRHARRVSVEILVGLAETVVISIGVIAALTAVGAIIGGGVGFVLGGATAAPGAVIGAEIGFEFALVILEWFGLAMLAVWLGKAIGEVGKEFLKFVIAVWDAHGVEAKLELAAKQFAEAIATLLGAILEAVLIVAASRGAGWASKALGETRFGRSFGESKFGDWLNTQLTEYHEGPAILSSHLKKLEASSSGALKKISSKLSSEELGNGLNKYYRRPRELLLDYYRKVEIVTRTKKGKEAVRGEFDWVDMGGKKFIEYKGARGLSRKTPHGYVQQTPAQWAEGAIFNKTVTRIETLLHEVTATRPGPNGSPSVPALHEIKGIRKIEFRIDGDTPALRLAVEKQLAALRGRYPDWTFQARFGLKLLLPPFPVTGGDESRN